MEAIVQEYVRKIDHYNFSGNERFNISEVILEGVDEQEILDKFYLKNRRCDASYYNKFKDFKWECALNKWYNSDDYKNRSFELYYKNSLVD